MIESETGEAKGLVERSAKERNWRDRRERILTRAKGKKRPMALVQKKDGCRSGRDRAAGKEVREEKEERKRIAQTQGKMEAPRHEIHEKPQPTRGRVGKGRNEGAKDRWNDEPQAQNPLSSRNSRGPTSAMRCLATTVAGGLQRVVQMGEISPSQTDVVSDDVGRAGVEAPLYRASRRARANMRAVSGFATGTRR